MFDIDAFFVNYDQKKKFFWYLFSIMIIKFTNICIKNIFISVVSWNSLGASKISNCVSISIILDHSSTKAYLIVGISMGSLALLGIGFIVYKKKKM